MTPDETERITREQLAVGPFPYEDTKWLQENKGANDEINPDLDYYLANIVGFALTASRLHERSFEQLQKYGPGLRSGFFEAFPHHGFLEGSINDVDTPKLHQRLVVTDQVRRAILPIIENLLSTEAKRKAIS